MPCDDKIRDWKGATASQGVPKIADSHQRLGRDKEEFFPAGFRGNMALLPI